MEQQTKQNLPLWTRDFTIITIGSVISMFGNALAGFAISLFVLDYTDTPLYYAYEMVRALAERYGVHIIGTELVGLTPAKALIDCAEYYLRIENFDCKNQVMEYHLIDMGQ